MPNCGIRALRWYVTSTRDAVHSTHSAWILNIGVPSGFQLILFQSKLIDKIHVRVCQERAFALPGAKRSVVAMARSLPRLARTVGRSRATEPALTVKSIASDEARNLRWINAAMEDAAADCTVVERPIVNAALAYVASYG